MRFVAVAPSLSAVGRAQIELGDDLESAIAEPDYREPEWLAGILVALRALAATGEPIVAQVV